MNVTENPKKTSASQIVKLDNALKLAEVWVNNMSKEAADDGTVDTVGRPYRLGLGAKVSRQTKVGPSNDPVERKLYAKLDAKKRQAANVAKDDLDDNEDSEDVESRTSAFAKRKTAVALTSSIFGNKKQKK